MSRTSEGVNLPVRGSLEGARPKPVTLPAPDQLRLETVMLPRDAFFGRTEPVVEYLRSGLAAGMDIPDAADPKLNTIKVHAG